MATIVVGYDGSDCARAALELALDAAVALGDTVLVAYAYDVSRMGGEVDDYLKALRERADEVITHAQHQADARGIAIDTVLAEQRPSDALTELADTHDARMIVIGSRGESPLRAALVGSTPHRLLQITDRPVLVVPVLQ